MVKKSAFFLDSLRQILHTLHRFVAILVISALGVAFFAGLRASGPDMRATAEEYLQQLNFMDIRILSTLGFSDKDIGAIQNTEGVSHVQGSYFADVLLPVQEQNYTIRLESFRPDQQINKPELIEGRLPATSGECVADADLSSRIGISIGDRITFVSGNQDDLDDSLKTTTYTVVGTVRNPLYISYERGSSSVGSGKTDAFFLIPQEDFSLSAYNEVYLKVHKPDFLSVFDGEFETILDRVVENLEITERNRSSLRLAEVRVDAQKKINEAKDEIKKGYEELENAKQELQDARKELDDAYKAYQKGKKTFEEEIKKAEEELLKGRQEYEQGLLDYQSGKEQFEKEITSAQQQLSQGYSQYEAGLKQYNESLAKFRQGKEAFEQNEQLFLQSKAAYEQGYQQYQDAVTLYNTINTALSQGNDPIAIATIRECAQALSQDQPEFSALLNAYAQDPDNPTIKGAVQAANGQFHTALESTRVGLEQAKEELDAAELEIEAARSQIAESELQLDGAKKNLDQAKAKLDASADQLASAKRQGEKELNEAKETLDKAEQDLIASEETLSKEQAKGKKKLDDALKKIQEGEEEYQKGKQEYDSESATALLDLQDAEQEVQDAQKKLDELKKPTWYILSHLTNPGYSGYKDDAARVDALSLVVPALFFLVAVLVTMTSMTRLVESDRSQIGTLKSLGYSNGMIASRYLLYAVWASLIGSVLGVFVGYNVFPRVIFNAYSMLYTLPPIKIMYDVKSAFFSVLIAVGCAALPAYLVCLRSLRQTPAALMRPPAPKAGKRTVLERITFLWKRLNFSQKVAARNLLRYKKRLFMTIFGIAGCTALMFTGFGLKDCVTTLVDKQYGHVQRYDVLINLQSGSKESEIKEVESVLKDSDSVAAYQHLAQEGVDVLKDNQYKEAYLTTVLPTDIVNLFHLQERTTGKQLTLTDEGAIITEKLASILDIKEGDTILLRNSDGEKSSVFVCGIAENYLFHYVYVTPSVYQSLFGKEAEANQIIASFAEGITEDDGLASDLLAQDAVTQVTFANSLREALANMVNALRYVVLVLIVSAAALVFVVLFSLTTINLEERSRELATIKVLGFYDKELAAYVYRENVVLTFIGIALGLLLGVLLQRYVITTMEIDLVMFSRDLLWTSYVFSSLLTLLFASLVNLMTMRRIKKIDMVSSLKSVE